MSKNIKRGLVMFSLGLVLLAATYLISTRRIFSFKENNAVETSDFENHDVNVEIANNNEELTEEEAQEEIIQAVEEDLEEITITSEEKGEDATVANANEEATEPSTKEEQESETTESVPTLPAYVPVKRSSNEIKIGFITDTHVSSFINEKGKRSLKNVFVERINPFVEKMNNEVVPDFIIINGDVIEGTGVPADVGMEELRLTKSLFDRTNIPKYWVVGNHDLRSVTKQQWKSTLGIEYLRKAFEVRDYKIIILDSNFNKKDKDAKPGSGYTRGRVSEEGIRWLKKELKETKKKPLVFIHHPPLWDTDVKTNSGLPDNAEELREIFSKYEVLAVFAGHIEDFYHEEVDGVNYFVTPGIYKHPKYPGAFSAISIKKDKIELKTSYLKNENEYRTITESN